VSRISAERWAKDDYLELASAASSETPGTSSNVSVARVVSIPCLPSQNGQNGHSWPTGKSILSSRGQRATPSIATTFFTPCLTRNCLMSSRTFGSPATVGPRQRWMMGATSAEMNAPPRLLSQFCYQGRTAPPSRLETFHAGPAWRSMRGRTCISCRCRRDIHLTDQGNNSGTRSDRMTKTV